MNEQISRTAVALRTGSPLLSIVPTNLDEVARIAKIAVMSGLSLTKKKWGDEEAKAEDEDARTLAVATMVILHGMEVGLPPMQALQTIALVNGRPLIWGDAVPALLWSAGFKLDEWFTNPRPLRDGEEPPKEWPRVTEPDPDNFNKFTAVCEITRPDGTKIRRTFSIDQAKVARLWDERAKVSKKGRDGKYYEAQNDSTWNRFWMRMLQMRARGFAVKDGASDVTRGLYMREEYEHNDVVDVTPQPVPSLPEIPDDIPELPAEPVSIPDELPELPSDAAPIESPEGFLEQLQFDVGLCDSVEELERIKASNAKAVASLPKEWQRKAQTIYDNAGGE